MADLPVRYASQTELPRPQDSVNVDRPGIGYPQLRPGGLLFPRSGLKEALIDA
jgi:hypothetical protein